jgi:hypothetical protein
MSPGGPGLSSSNILPSDAKRERRRRKDVDIFDFRDSDLAAYDQSGRARIFPSATSATLIHRKYLKSYSMGHDNEDLHVARLLLPAEFSYPPPFVTKPSTEFGPYGCRHFARSSSIPHRFERKTLPFCVPRPESSSFECAQNLKRRAHDDKMYAGESISIKKRMLHKWKCSERNGNDAVVVPSDKLSCFSLPANGTEPLSTEQRIVPKASSEEASRLQHNDSDLAENDRRAIALSGRPSALSILDPKVDIIAPPISLTAGDTDATLAKACSCLPRTDQDDVSMPGPRIKHCLLQTADPNLSLEIHNRSSQIQSRGVLEVIDSGTLGANSGHDHAQTSEMEVSPSKDNTIAKHFSSPGDNFSGDLRESGTVRGGNQGQGLFARDSKDSPELAESKHESTVACIAGTSVPEERKLRQVERRFNLVRQYEIQKISGGAHQKEHVKMNLRGRTKLEAWLTEAPPETLRAVQLIGAAFDLDERITSSVESARKAALHGMNNEDLRACEALMIRMNTRDGQANWHLLFKLYDQLAGPI